MLLGAAPSWEHRVPFDYGPTKKKKKRKTKLLFRRYSTVNPSVTPQKHASPLTKERLSFLHPAHTMGDDRVCYLDALPDRIRLIAEESPAEVGSCIDHRARVRRALQLYTPQMLQDEHGADRRLTIRWPYSDTRRVQVSNDAIHHREILRL